MDNLKVGTLVYITDSPFASFNNTVGIIKVVREDFPCGFGVKKNTESKTIYYFYEDQLIEIKGKLGRVLYG